MSTSNRALCAASGTSEVPYAAAAARADSPDSDDVVDHRHADFPRLCSDVMQFGCTCYYPPTADFKITRPTGSALEPDIAQAWIALTGGWLASTQSTGCLNFVECSPRHFTELAAVDFVAPTFIGDLPGESAQFSSNARGELGNASALERADH